MMRHVGWLGIWLVAGAAAIAQTPTVSTQSLHIDAAGKLVQEFTLPAGMTLNVEPDGTLRFGGVNGWTMNFGSDSGQMQMEWPQGALTFNAGTGILDFNGTVRANAYQGPFEGVVNLVDSESVVFGAHQITSGVMAGARLPWPYGMMENTLPLVSDLFPVNTPYFLRWTSTAPDSMGGVTWRSAVQTLGDLGMLSTSTSINWPSIAAGTRSTQTMTVTGALTTAEPVVTLGWSAALPAGILLAQAWVSANNTVSICLHNTSGAAVDPPNITVRAEVRKW